MRSFRAATPSNTPLARVTGTSALRWLCLLTQRLLLKSPLQIARAARQFRSTPRPSKAKSYSLGYATQSPNPTPRLSFCLQYFSVGFGDTLSLRCQRVERPWRVHRYDPQNKMVQIILNFKMFGRVSIDQAGSGR